MGDNPSHPTLSLLPTCSALIPPRRKSHVLFNCLYHRAGRRWLCNPEGFSVFIPLQPENILIELPTLPSCISLTSAPGLGFCCVPSLLEHLSPLPLSPASRLSELIPVMLEVFGPWAQCDSTGASSFPPSPFPGAALSRLQSRGNISVVASGCSWLPPFPWILGAPAPLGLPQLLSTPCLQLSISPGFSRWVLDFFHWAKP